MENARFLGVYTDEKLQWNEHISQISAKVSKNIGILKKISHLLSTPVLLQLYNTLVLSYLNYCNMIGLLLQKHYLISYKSYKKAVRIVNKSARRAHTDPLFNTFSTTET